MTNITLLLLVTGAVVVAGYFIFRLLIKFSRKPILEINLSPLDHPRWSDNQKITDLVDSFLRNGFEAAGNYEGRPVAGVYWCGEVDITKEVGSFALFAVPRQRRYRMQAP
jgi:hypothetical protein